MRAAPADSAARSAIPADSRAAASRAVNGESAEGMAPAVNSGSTERFPAYTVRLISAGRWALTAFGMKPRTLAAQARPRCPGRPGLVTSTVPQSRSLLRRDVATLTQGGTRHQVEDRDVRPVRTGHGERLGPAGGLGDHGQVGLCGQRGERAPDQLLGVGERYAYDCHRVLLSVGLPMPCPPHSVAGAVLRSRTVPVERVPPQAGAFVCRPGTALRRQTELLRSGRLHDTAPPGQPFAHSYEA